MNNVSFVDRDPVGPKETLKIEGMRVGKLVVRELVGFHANLHSVWKCDCDCGRTTQKLGAHLMFAKRHAAPGKYKIHTHCGCLSRWHPDGRTNLTEYSRWQRLLPKLADRWRKSFDLYKDECERHRCGLPHLCRVNRLTLIGPDNFFWSNHTERFYKIIDDCAAVIVATRRVPQEEAHCLASKMTKQGRYAVINRYQSILASNGINP